MNSPLCPEHLLPSLRQTEYDRMMAGLFLPPEQREALHVALAFNQELAQLRETVSEPMIGVIRLQWWREALEDIYAGKAARQHELLVPLAELISSYEIPYEVFDEWISAREQDMEEEPPADMQALLRYAEGSGAGVFLLGAYAAGAGENPDALAAARQAGRVWALAGILRAVPYHAATGCVLLPQAMLRAEGIDAQTVIAGDKHASIQAVCERVHAEAMRQLEEFKQQEEKVPALVRRWCLPVVLAERYLRKMEHMDFVEAAARLRRPGWWGLVKLYGAARNLKFPLLPGEGEG